MTNRHIAVIGSRNYWMKWIEHLSEPIADRFKEAAKLTAEMFQYHHMYTSIGSCDVIVSGGAHGPDYIAEKHALAITGNAPLVLKPDWDKYGKAAGFIRNGTIIENADEVLAFWDEKSRGTLDSIRKAEKRKIPVTVINADTNFRPYGVIG